MDRWMAGWMDGWMNPTSKLTTNRCYKTNTFSESEIQIFCGTTSVKKRSQKHK